MDVSCFCYFFIPGTSGCKSSSLMVPSSSGNQPRPSSSALEPSISAAPRPASGASCSAPWGEQAELGDQEDLELRSGDEI